MDKYAKWYICLMGKASVRRLHPKDGERHHVIPRSLGGSNDRENIAVLTYREHFVAHWLLTKVTTGNAKRKMMYALTEMSRRGRSHHRRVMSWQYELSKRISRELATNRRLSPESRKKLSIAKTGSKASKETRAKMSTKLIGNTRMRGKILSQETRKKMSKSRLGNQNTKGHKLTDQHKKNISNSLMGNTNSVGRKLTAEHIAAIREGHRQYWKKRRTS